MAMPLRSAGWFMVEAEIGVVKCVVEVMCELSAWVALIYHPTCVVKLRMSGGETKAKWDEIFRIQGAKSSLYISL
jgi:hypothetical protein